MIRTLWTALVSLVLTAGPALAAQQPATEGFLPADQLPPDQQLPAAPFLIGAYAFIWLALMFYLWTIWRRLGAVEKDMQTLSGRLRK